MVETIIDVVICIAAVICISYASSLQSKLGKQAARLATLTFLKERKE